jgi:two-component system phosphate regulon sensor histidine kinase PhoR
MKRSLSFQFVFFMALMILLSLVIMGIIFSNKINQEGQNQQESQLLQAANAIADQLNSNILSDAERVRINTQIHDLAQVSGYRITIVLPDGKVYSDSLVDAETMENHLDRPEIQSALQGNQSTQIRYSRTAKQQLMYTAVPIKHDDKVIGVVRTSYPLTVIETTLQKQRNQVNLSLFLTAVVVITLSALFSLSLTRPIKKLTLQVRSFESNPESEFPESKRKDEIGQLEKAFHRMARQVRTRITELDAESNRLLTVLRNMTDGIIIVNSKGIVERINNTGVKMFHISREDAIGKSVVEVLRQYQLVELWKACVATRKQQTTTVETSPDRLFIQGIASPITWLDPDSVMLILQDLTRIHQLETVRKDFVSNVSHELRTPLTSLKALTETIHETVKNDPESTQKFLLLMDQEVDNLTQLLNELIELSRLESGRVPLDRKRISPSVILKAVDEMMRLQAERNGLTFTIHYPDEITAISADQERVKQVMTNLIHNAIKFTKPGGSITVSVNEQEDKVVFQIEDTGAGIEPDVLPRIFERFYKADQSRSSAGAGLGLSISRHIVEAHGGNIWAESEPGVGSKFFFSLPKALE